MILLLYHARRLGRHEKLVGVVGSDMAIVSTVLQPIVTTNQVMVVNHGRWLGIIGGDVVGIVAD